MPRLLIPALGLTMAGFGVATASAQTDPVITIPIAVTSALIGIPQWEGLR